MNFEAQPAFCENRVSLTFVLSGTKARLVGAGQSAGAAAVATVRSSHSRSSGREAGSIE